METYRGNGTGGNERIGKLKYGKAVEALDVHHANNQCHLENQYVRVIDNNGTEVEWDEYQEEPAVYDCQEIDDFVNGAYSPLLDALYYGTVVGRMYEQWYNTTPLQDKMLFRIHYGQKYDNAFWNGHECCYGDGDEYYPFVTLDTAAHEAGHGITEQNSGLFYFGQAGGLNEAFSDMAGETAEMFEGEADWVHGMDNTRGDVADRYLKDQSVDGYSIIHVDDWYDSMDPHYASGVYNRVFYLLVHDYKMPVKEIFGVFLTANLMYWQSTMDYVRGACDVMKAAYDRGQNGDKFRKAFAEVSIDVCDVQDHVVALKNSERTENITVSKNVTPTFTFGVVGFLLDGYQVTAESPDGEVNITVSSKVWGSSDENITIYGQGVGEVYVQVDFDEVRFITIELSTDSDQELTNVNLMASDECRSTFCLVSGDELSKFQFQQWIDSCEGGEEK